jgi:hypothetical protein
MPGKITLDTSALYGLITAQAAYQQKSVRQAADEMDVHPNSVVALQRGVVPKGDTLLAMLTWAKITNIRKVTLVDGKPAQPPAVARSV